MVQACTCASVPNDLFASINTNQTPGYFDGYSIVKGSIIGLTLNGYGVRIKVLYKYSGPPIFDTVTVWGSYGSDCRASLRAIYNSSQVDTFIIAMRHLSGRLAAFEDLDDYAVSSCGHYVLKVKGDSVYGGGPGSFSQHGFPLRAFEDSLGHYVKVLAVATLTATKSATYKVFPNPAHTTVILSWESGGPGKLGVVLIDASGRIVRTFDPIRKLANVLNEERIDLTGIAAGNYFLTITDYGKINTLPFVILNSR